VTALTLILPYLRSSPLHIPRRDLVLSAADSLALRVTIVERDDPSAQALELTGGIGGPTCMLLVYPDSSFGRWDYGAPRVCPGTVLWSGMGAVSDAIGSFDIAIPTGALARGPRRCAWALMLDWDGGGQAEMIAEGYLHIRPTGQRLIAPVILLDDAGQPILLDGALRDFSAADFAVGDFS
jgi:hypothetical protein